MDFALCVYQRNGQPGAAIFLRHRTTASLTTQIHRASGSVTSDRSADVSHPAKTRNMHLARVQATWDVAEAGKRICSNHPSSSTLH